MKEKLSKLEKALEPKKSWHWLVYLYIVVPGLLFLLAYILRGAALGETFAKLFHNYAIFCISPIPRLPSFTGVFGMLLALWMLFSAIRRRDWADLLITALMVAAAAAFFLTGLNYRVSAFILKATSDLSGVTGTAPLF